MKRSRSGSNFGPFGWNTSPTLGLLMKCSCSRSTTSQQTNAPTFGTRPTSPRNRCRHRPHSSWKCISHWDKSFAMSCRRTRTGSWTTHRCSRPRRSCAPFSWSKTRGTSRCYRSCCRCRRGMWSTRSQPRPIGHHCIGEHGWNISAYDDADSRPH